MIIFPSVLASFKEITGFFDSAIDDSKEMSSSFEVVIFCTSFNWKRASTLKEKSSLRIEVTLLNCSSDTGYNSCFSLVH